MLDIDYFTDWFINIDKGFIQLVKTKTEHYCRFCDKKISKGAYCYGRRYCKTCIDCMEKAIKVVKFKLTETYQEIKEVEENLNNNKGDYVKNNLVSNL